jgi:hypothetical protein
MIAIDEYLLSVSNHDLYISLYQYLCKLYTIVERTKICDNLVDRIDSTSYVACDT